MYITLLRSPAYAAHPSPSQAIQCAADYSNIPRMDQGEQFFSFRIIADSSDRFKAGISRYAQAFNEKPYVLSFFPEGPEAVTEPFMHLSQDSSILAGAFKKAENDNGYILRLFEEAGLPGETRVDIPALGIKQKAVLKPFEIRTYRCAENKMEVCSLMEEQAEGDGILRLMENRVRHMYRGGAGIEKIHGRTPLDSDCPEEWIGSVVEAGNSAMRLALQAHPDRSYAKKYLNSSWGKMECYYILDVREYIEPYIYLGFQHAPTRAEWKGMVETQDLEAMGRCFEKIKVGKGEFWYIPAGLVHAIGEGITMLEIMEPSDWVIRCEFELQKGRRLPYEARYMKKSIDEVLDIFDYNEYSVDEIRWKACLEPEIITDTPNLKRLRMISQERTGCFGVEVMDIYVNQRIHKGQQPAVIIILEGSGTLSCNQSQLDIKAGDSFFAAGMEESFQVMLSSGQPVKLCMVMPKNIERRIM